MKETGISIKRSDVRCQCPVSSSEIWTGFIFDEGLSSDECIEIWDTLEPKNVSIMGNVGTREVAQERVQQEY